MVDDPRSVPFDLVIESGGDQFPVSPPRPELSWKLPEGVASQTGFELEATVAGMRREHRGVGDGHRFVQWPWPDLSSTQRVEWRVRVMHEAGVSRWSDSASFEAGLFEQNWSAQWISAPEPELPLGTRPAYDLYTTFTLDALPDDARLYATALGVYEAFVNDQRVGTSELAPGTTSYDRTLYAQAFDVTAALVAGENVLRVRVSDGWARGRAGAFRKPALWSEHTAIRAELHVEVDSQRAVVASSDTSWRAAETEIQVADLMDGQVSNFQLQPQALGNVVSADVSAPQVTWSPAPPVRVTAQLPPVKMTRLGPDDVVVDFGQNASGWVRLTNLGDVGARTTLVFGEHVGPDGHVTLSHLDSALPTGGVVAFEQRDEVISDGSGAVFEPRHTIHGFQYVQIHRAGLELDAADLTMQVVNSDLRPVGGFSSSSADLNRLWEVADWSFRGNAVDVPTDCPTRERAGWTGDWQIFLPTAARLYDVDGFSRKWLQSVRDDQLDDGRIVNISPDHGRLRTFPDPGVDMATGSAGWGDAIVLVPWDLYREYGDTRILADSWDAMVRWVDFALDAAATKRHPSRVEHSPEPLPHEQFVWDGTFHFGEWCEPTPIAEDGTPGPMMPDPMAWAMSDKGEVGTAYLYRSLLTLSMVADVLGRGDDAERYRDLAKQVKAAWRVEFIDSHGRTPNGTQASYVRALSFGLVPDDLREQAAARLVELIEGDQGHLGTGFLSTADLLPVLADTGHRTTAEGLLFQRTSPSWLGMLDRGATTIWEEWEGVDRNGNAHASLNHYSKGAVIRYLHSHVLGLQQDAGSTAWSSFTIAPVLPDGLDWAKGHLDSPQGLIDVAWHFDGDDAELVVTVPGGATATVRWGDEIRSLVPGSHTIRTSRAAALAAAPLAA